MLSSKSTSDLRSGKQISRRASLPSFSWSHASSGHCRTSSDVVKLSTNKGTCQGRWLRIGTKIASSIHTGTDTFTDLDSLAYDSSLVPSGLKMACPDNIIPTPISIGLPHHEKELSSSATCSKVSLVTIGNIYRKIASLSCFYMSTWFCHICPWILLFSLPFIS